MHSYLRSIGFTNIKKKSQEKNLLADVVSTCDSISIIQTETDQDEYMAVVDKQYSDDFRMGIRTYGEFDDNQNFHAEAYLPYIEAGDVSTKAGCTIHKPSATEVLFGVSEDYRVGLSLIFTISNFGDVLKYKEINGKDPNIEMICFSGLCEEGKILLPVYKTQQQRVEAKKESSARCELLKAAKSGDREAIEDLTVDDMNTYNIASKRAANEDIYSIIDSYILPVGVECDQYQIMAEILDISESMNTQTQEEMYLFLVETNDIRMNLLINKKDLIGMPAIGRRIKCSMWLQGEVVMPEYV